MHRQTAWSRTGGLPSDRLAPTPPRNSPRTSPKPATVPLANVPRSREVARIEAFIAGLHSPNAFGAKDLKGGCFCLGQFACAVQTDVIADHSYLSSARTHALSTYNPLCLSCGLILCSLNYPFNVCPHCASSLVVPAHRPALLARVQDELATQIRNEELAAERERDELRARAGAFPTLGGATPALSDHNPRPEQRPAPPTQPQTHKVLSLGTPKGKGRAGKVTISSYTTTPAVAGSSGQQQIAQAAKPKDEDPLDDPSQPPRVPPPPKEQPHARKVDGRRWEDRRPGAVGAIYVPPKPAAAAAQVAQQQQQRQQPIARYVPGAPIPVEGAASGSNRRRRRKKADGSANAEPTPSASS